MATSRPRGRAGGRLIYLIADTVTGTGGLVANGSPGESTTGTHRDGAGGGGSGGTVVVGAQRLDGVQHLGQRGQRRPAAQAIGDGTK